MYTNIQIHFIASKKVCPCHIQTHDMCIFSLNILITPHSPRSFINILVWNTMKHECYITSITTSCKKVCYLYHRQTTKHCNISVNDINWYNLKERETLIDRRIWSSNKCHFYYLNISIFIFHTLLYQIYCSINM